MKNIILIGMMGSGKSTISQELSQKISFDIVDTDDAIEKEEGISIDEIFKKYGENYFRNLEKEYTKKLVEVKNKSLIISTGGGLILNDENVSVLKSIGNVIYLRGTVDTLYNRLVDKTHSRPLLEKKELKEKLENILGVREKLYENSSHYIIDIDGKSIDDIIKEIISIKVA